ncbi:hypothetical protein Tcan_17248 [Toxocara canis]|uniref:Uncharacterized protein n=1 Tax=Toxocara canis TaxID=6265 RepID=A0A0B2VP52_TOXCA|nr:hypothetical protein Tcan_17248 [Toxocara canis]
MPSSPLVASTLNYPPSAEGVIHHDPLAMSSSDSKRSELFSILDDDSELRRLCDDDNASNLPTSPVNVSCSQSRSLADNHKGRAAPKRAPRKKHSPDVAPTSSSECLSASSDINSEGSAYVTPYSKMAVHCYHPYNTPSIYENTPKLKHKKCNLRSTAPVLYDLLSDDCEAGSRDRSNAIPYTSALTSELCRSVDLYLNPLPLPLPLVATSTLPLLPPHDQRPIAYFNNLMQQSLLMNSAPINLLKMVQPADSLTDWPTTPAFGQTPLSTQLCKELENLPTECALIGDHYRVSLDKQVYKWKRCQNGSFEIRMLSAVGGRLIFVNIMNCFKFYRSFEFAICRAAADIRFI